MITATLKPFLRYNLDILFVGLNPAKGSDKNGHYFSVNCSFWKQLHLSGLITEEISKASADVTIFGSSKINYNGLAYGITDLVTNIAESNSAKIKPSAKDCEKLVDTIVEYKPRIVVLLHSKVLKAFMKHLDRGIPPTNCGRLGKLIDDQDTEFFSVAFPHGSGKPQNQIIERYIEIKNFVSC